MKVVGVVLVVCALVVLTLSVVDALSCDASLSVCYGVDLYSPLGFGAVELCGDCYVCGRADGVCPEDFNDGQLVANCSGCADPDCVVTLNGSVSVQATGNPIGNGFVTALVQHVPGYEEEYTTQVSYWGDYSFEVPRGRYQVKFTKAGYETRIVDFPLEQGSQLTHYQLNVSLANGSCHTDCTGHLYEGQTPLCQKSCHQYSVESDRCYFYTDVASGFFGGDVCDGVPIGSTVEAANNGTHSLTYRCCEALSDDPGFHWVRRPKVDISQSDDIKNVVKFKTALRSDGYDGIVFIHIISYAK